MVRTPRDLTYRRRVFALVLATAAAPLHATRPQDLLENHGSTYNIEGEGPRAPKPTRAKHKSYLDRSRADSHHRTESLLQQKNDAEVGNANHVHRGEEHSHNKHKMHHTRSSRGTENAEALSEERRSIRGQHAKCCKCVGESSRGIWSYSGECQDQCKVRFATEKVDQHIKKATPGCDPTPKEFENFTDKEKQLCEAACVDKFNGETDEQIAEKFAKGSESNANDANTKTDGKEPLEMPKFNLAGKGEQQSNNNNNNDEATTTPPLQIKKSTAVSMTVLSMMAIVPVLATIARNTLSA